MLIVRIYVNDTPIREGYAVRIKGEAKPSSVNIYRLHDDTIVKHRYGDGAVKLARKILRKVKS